MLDIKWGRARSRFGRAMDVSQGALRYAAASFHIGGIWVLGTRN